MAHTAGKSRKTHKSVKTAPDRELGGGPSSSTDLTTVPKPAPSNMLKNDIEAMLRGVDEEVAEGTATAPEVDTGVPTEDPKKQWWYRPKDSKARKIAEKIVVMRAAGRHDDYIAKKLDTTEGSVRQYMYVARKNGWLDAEDEPVDLEVEMALTTDRKIVRNVNASLDGQMTNWQTHEMTIAAAKGRGHFKNHETAKVEHAGGMPLVAIQVIMPPIGASDQLPHVQEDAMGGVPAYLEGDVAGD